MNRENSLEVIDSGANLKQELEQMGNLSELAMRITGKLDYLEMPALNGSLDATKNFYARAFGWAFTDYGPTYSAFAEGLDGGFDAQSSTAKPLPVLFAANLEEALDAVTDAGGAVVKPIFTFPGGRRFHFTDPAGNELAVWSDK
ncbi:glyoxalase family protein [Brucella abortus str. 2308 A]|nr:glyoxalase family protein [Brucella ceti str. Cudo]EEP64016.1 glyoxalase family protein [Brucella abortus str. 2308 A]